MATPNPKRPRMSPAGRVPAMPVDTTGMDAETKSMFVEEHNRRLAFGSRQAALVPDSAGAVNLGKRAKGFNVGNFFFSLFGGKKR